MRGVQTSLKKLLKELEKDFLDVDDQKICHHVKEVQTLVSFCWRQLTDIYDPISSAADTVADRGDNLESSPYLMELSSSLDIEQLRHKDFAAWALLQLRPGSAVAIKPVLIEVVKCFKNEQKEQAKFSQPEFANIVEYLDIARSSFEAVVKLRALAPDHQPLFCASPKCLHVFQYTWMQYFFSNSSDASVWANAAIKEMIGLAVGDMRAASFEPPRLGAVAAKVERALEELRKLAKTDFFAVIEAVTILRKLAKPSSPVVETQLRSVEPEGEPLNRDASEDVSKEGRIVASPANNEPEESFMPTDTITAVDTSRDQGLKGL